MEEVLLNIDSRYRDILVYPNECKFRYNLEKMYKNIISARMISIEVNNSATYLDEKKHNNFLTIYLPNRVNDPDGIKVQLDQGLYQIVGVIQNMFNGLFQDLFNNNSVLKRKYLDGKPFAEKYFYFFYLNYDIEITFDFNSLTEPATLQNKLKFKTGWYSMYGLVLQIQNYIITKYNERKKTVSNGTEPIDSGNFTMGNFTLPIFDRRFRHANKTYDCVRYDSIDEIKKELNSLDLNLAGLKEQIYKTYINDTITFIPISNKDSPDQKILDQLNTGEYLMSLAPNGFNYSISSGNKLNSKSIYHLNIAYGSDDPTFPTLDSTQIYNLIMQVDLTSLKISFSNYFTQTKSTSATQNFAFYYYYSPLPTPLPVTDTTQTWKKVVDDKIINLFDNLISDKDFAYQQQFITLAQRDDPSFTYSSEKDIADFEIDFSTYPIVNPVTNGIVDIKKIVYPPVGYYLGFRPDIIKTTDQFIFSGIIDNTERIMRGTKIFDTTGDDYMFLRINDWGYIDFFGKKMFAKVLLTTGLGNPKIDDYVNKEFRFRQPIDVNKLDIELVDYLGNTIDLGGFDWSFTLEFKQIVNSTEKTVVERNALVFNTVYKS